MKNSHDFTAMFQDMFAAFPLDAKTIEKAVQDTADVSEKFSAVALAAAAQSADVSTKWTKTTLGKMTELSKAKSDPADVSKAVSEFASASAETAAEHMAAFAEIAKKVQLDTVELMLAAGKDLQDDAAEVVNKATSDFSKAAKKAAA